MLLILATLATLTTAEKININKSPADTLATYLPGVGPAIAERIVQGRPYSKCSDLSETVKGIGKKKIAKICPLLAF